MKKFIVMLFVFFGVRDSFASQRYNNVAPDLSAMNMQVAIAKQQLLIVSKIHEGVIREFALGGLDKKEDLDICFAFGRTLQTAEEYLKRIRSAVVSDRQIRDHVRCPLDSLEKQHDSLVGAISDRAVKILLAQRKSDRQQQEKERQWLIELVRNLEMVAQSLPE